MADNNNAHVMNLPKEPNLQLKKLAERLVGKWQVKGPEIDGTIEYELMEGGFFLIQHIDFVQGVKRLRGSSTSAMTRIPIPCVRTLWLRTGVILPIPGS